MSTLTDQMNRLLLLTHLHVASFSHHETQYVRPCFMQIILLLETPPKNSDSKHLQKPDGRVSKWTILSLYNITQSQEFGQNHRLLSSLVLSICYMSKYQI